MKKLYAQIFCEILFSFVTYRQTYQKKKKTRKVKWAVSLKFHIYGGEEILPLVSFTFPSTENRESWGSYVIGKILFLDLGDACIEDYLVIKDWDVKNSNHMIRWTDEWVKGWIGR